MNTLYLTTDERKLYDALPASLKSEWKGAVEDETGTAWENEDQLQSRRNALTAILPEELEEAGQKIIAAVAEGKSLDDVDVAIPEDMLPTVFFLLGAKGLSDFMAAHLQAAQKEQDLTTVAILSDARHALLINNSVFISKSPLYGRSR